MNLSFLAMMSDFDDIFDNIKTGQIIAIVFSSIIFVAVAITIIVSIVKTVKKSKSIEDVIISKIKLTPDKDSDQYIVCDYCGTSNEKGKPTCSACGASLNRSKKQK